MSKKQIWLNAEQVDLLRDILRYARGHMLAEANEKYPHEIAKVCSAFCARRVAELQKLISPDAAAASDTAASVQHKEAQTK